MTKIPQSSRPEPPFAIADREGFLAAIERHRRASWRVSAACALAVTVLATVVAILMAPLLYCTIGLVFDLANFISPMPDIMGWLGRQIDVLSSSATFPVAIALRTAIIVATPGATLMAIAAYGLRRAWSTSRVLEGEVSGRPPDGMILAEQRLANVVEEMAIAAAIAPPRLLIVPGGINASVSGFDDAHVTLLVGDGALACVSRDQLEGMIAHLIGSIVNGDLPIGARVATTLSLFGLLARIGSSFTDQRATVYAMQLWRVFVARRGLQTIAALDALTEPFEEPRRADREAQEARAANGLTWREWLIMPLMGPVLLSGFLSGLVSQIFLQPLIAYAWRQRKYMADATAVQLTRNPDALAGALAAIAGSPTAITLWTAHMAVAADPRGKIGPFGRSIVPIFPSVQKRVDALDRMGAHVSLRPRPAMPLPIAVVLGALLSVVAGLMAIVVFLLVMVSTAISGLFTIFPAAALHFLLRWAAG